jgi:predicted secreted protein
MTESGRDTINAYFRLIDCLVARVELIEQSLRAQGIKLPEWNDEALENWISERAQRMDERRDPRR